MSGEHSVDRHGVRFSFYMLHARSVQHQGRSALQLLLENLATGETLLEGCVAGGSGAS